VTAKGVGKNLGVKVEYLTRVEGHGNIVVEVKDGALAACRFEVVESPRFFEALLRGRSIFEAQHITSRICGICACAHSLTSIQAAEEALGVIPSAQTIALRRILLDLEFIDSHVLHIYLLALPDLVGAKSFLPLVATHEKVVRRALRLKKTVNQLADVLVGRHVHAIGCTCRPTRTCTRSQRPSAASRRSPATTNSSNCTSHSSRCAPTWRRPWRSWPR
jgi:sulfhydrogenase subunit alpha